MVFWAKEKHLSCYHLSARREARLAKGEEKAGVLSHEAIMEVRLPRPPSDRLSLIHGLRRVASRLQTRYMHFVVEVRWFDVAVKMKC